MNRRTQFFCTFGLVVCTASSAWAQDIYRSYDYAKVISAQPLYKSVERSKPTQHCWVETVQATQYTPSHQSATPTLLGAVIGGAIGHAVGDGKKNKRMGAVVGTLIGGSVGKDISQRRSNGPHAQTSYQDVERCETRYKVSRHQQFDGYQVDYKYQGRVYSTKMDYDPGDRLKIRVQLEPVID